MQQALTLALDLRMEKKVEPDLKLMAFHEPDLQQKGLVLHQRIRDERSKIKENKEIEETRTRVPYLTSDQI